MSIIDYIKRKLKKRQQKRTFQEFGHEVRSFQLEGIGKIDYAQWQHPSEKPKNITRSNIDFYQKLARPGSVIIDIGAHTGDTTVPMALAVGKEGLVIAFEPNKYVYKVLEKNSTLNPEATNIHPYCFAATAEDGEFTFNYSDASFCNGGFLSQINYRNHKHNYELKVEGRNLEKFLLEKYRDKLSSVDLLKIDAEGYDKEILKTLPVILREYKPNLMVECYKRLNNHERYELYDIIAGHGYELFYLENFESNGIKKKIERSNMTDEKHFEMLAIHKSK